MSRPVGASLRWQAIVNAAGNLSFFGAVFLLTPFAIGELGKEAWGIWQLVGATTAYAGLLSLGLGTAIHYQVAYNLARDDVARLAQAFTCARAYLGAAAALLLVGLVFAGKPLLRTLVEPEALGLAWSALWLTVGLTALTLPLRVFTSTLAGLQRLDLVGASQVGAALFLVVAVWWGFRADLGLQGFAAAMTLGALLPILPAWLLSRRMLPAGALRLTRIDFALLRELIAYSLSTVIYVVGTVVVYQTMKFVAAWRCGGATAAGEMGLAISIVQTLGVVFVPILGTLHARFGQLHGDGRHEEIRELLGRALVAAGLMVVPSIVFLLADAHLIFDAWVGRELDAATLDALAQTTRAMLVGQGLYILALPCYYALLGIGRHRPFGIGMLVTGVANAALGWALAGPYPSITTLGAVFGVSMALLAILVPIPLALRRFPQAPLPLLVRAVLLPLLASGPGLIAILWRPRVGQPILDLVIDGLVFVVLAAPGLELMRRRFLGAARSTQNGEVSG